MLISILCYQVRRFPRAARQKTKHHSAWCTHGQKWSQEPSTLEEDEPVMIERKCSSVSWSISRNKWNEVVYVCNMSPHISFTDVIGVFIHVSGQPKVTYLHHVVLRKEDVSGCQVPVDALQTQSSIMMEAIIIMNSKCSRSVYTHTHRPWLCVSGLPSERLGTPCLWPLESYSWWDPPLLGDPSLNSLYKSRWHI